MEKLNATKHYLHYPKGEFLAFLAYGFRPIFLLLAPYMVLHVILWGLFWTGILPLSFLNDPIKWHVYELVFGVGSAGIMGFLLTALPELYPGVVPLVGKKLAFLVGIWLLGRISFWFIDYLSIYLVSFLNLLPLVLIALYAFKPTILDKTQKHASIAYNLLIIIFIQFYFFGIEAGIFDGNAMSVLNLSIGAFMTLILLALRRINMEAVNEWLESRKIDDVLMVHPPRYNLAIFCITLFTCSDFFFPQNSALGWLGFAASASILGVLSEYKMKDSFILFEPYVLYLSTIVVMMALGYGCMGYLFFDESFGTRGNFSHFLTIGAFGISFFMVLVIVSFVHTGRYLQANWVVTTGIIMLIFATFIRVSANFVPQFSTLLYALSSFLWAGAFSLYFVQFYKFLISPRADGIKG